MTKLSNQPSLSLTDEQSKLQTMMEKVLSLAKKNGASQAEAHASVERGFSVAVRKGEVETLEYNRDKVLAITVYFDKRRGSASTSDTSDEALATTIQAACDIAQYTETDPFSGLADKEELAFNYPNLDLYHPWALSPEQAIEIAKNAEAKAFAVDKRITNSEGASISTHDGIHVYANSHGFVGAYPSSHHSFSCVLVAEAGGNMQRDYDFTSARDPADLDKPNQVALSAAKKTLERLNGRRLTTRKAPIIFAADVARGLLGHFVSAASGGKLYRDASFLLDHLGKKVFPDFINLIEYPHLAKALGSAPYDNEGVKTREKNIVKNGILESYLLGCYSARKLGLQTTGNSGGVHNLTINTSDIDLPALLKQMGTGLLVTEVIGQGVNIVNGDYSRGAAGFWVENGEIVYPVEEITIAGNLKQMLGNIVMVANDVDIRGSIRSGSILIEEMMIAGE